MLVAPELTNLGQGKQRVQQGVGLESRRALERLEEYRRELAELIAGARIALRSSDVAARQALATQRWQAVRALRGFQLFKHTEIFDPLSRHPDPARAERARRMKARCLEMGQAYTDHVQRWSMSGIAATFPEYRREALTMLNEMERHLDHERTEAALLLAGVERTRRF